MLKIKKSLIQYIGILVYTPLVEQIENAVLLEINICSIILSTPDLLGDRFRKQSIKHVASRLNSSNVLVTRTIIDRYHL